MQPALTGASAPIRNAPPLAATRRRWEILRQQLAAGRDPCFQSERRYACTERDCPWRAECVVMRAEWMR